MPENRNRNYTFAVLLIALGAVLLMQQLGIWQIPWSRLWVLWPLVLVFLGLEILLRRVPMGGLIYLVLVAAILGGVWLIWPRLATRWGALETRTTELPLSGITSAAVDIAMGVGELEVRALREPDLLYRATLHYDSRRTELVESRQVRGGQAEVKLEFRGVGGGAFVTGDRGRLEVALARELPLALSIEAGVSRSRIALDELTLTGLEVRGGVGDVEIVLPQGDYEVTVNGGVGALAIELPEDVGAQIEIEGGLGSAQVADRFLRSGDTYTAEGTGNIRLRIRGGIGAVTVR